MVVANKVVVKNCLVTILVKKLATIFKFNYKTQAAIKIFNVIKNVIELKIVNINVNYCAIYVKMDRIMVTVIFVKK